MESSILIERGCNSVEITPKRPLKVVKIFTYRSVLLTICVSSPSKKTGDPFLKSSMRSALY